MEREGGWGRGKAYMNLKKKNLNQAWSSKVGVINYSRKVTSVSTFYHYYCRFHPVFDKSFHFHYLLLPTFRF